MNPINNEKDPGKGYLQPIAPLANPYVPFQMENPDQYEVRKGLVRGTLYPGLDLPFMGKVNKSLLPVTPLSELQAIGFALQELALYLDTHRDDEEALELYHRYRQLYRVREMEYEKKHGPMTHMSMVEGNEYSWLHDPWPWEYCSNKEG